MDSNLILTLDIGGTKILGALVSDKVLVREYIPTQADEGPDAVIGRIGQVIEKLLQGGKGRVRSICVAVAGPIDSRRGLVTTSPNLPGWENVPLRQLVADRFGMPTFMTNDAKAATLGEHRFGVGRGTSNMLLLTLGTGIGGGIIINGKLYGGASGSAGELGHMTVDVAGPKCACGNTGCLEMLASGTAIERDAIGRISRGEKSSLAELVSGRINEITARDVEKAARNGDALSADVINRAVFYLGVGLASLVNIFNPEMIVLSGGMSRMGDLIVEPARKVVKERAFPISAGMARIVTGELVEDAALLGAAAFARDQEKNLR